MLVNLNVKEFVNETESSNPVPGGGSIAALAGALSAALSGMVAGLTIGKNGYEDCQEEMKEVAEKARKIKEKLIDLVDKDATSFDEVMKAFKLPKNTDEEKQIRTKTIQEGMKYAASVPFDTAKTAAEMMDLAEIVIEKGNSNAVTDGAVSAMLSRTAVLSALLNVKINLGSIKDKDFVSDYEKKISDLENSIVIREKEVLAKVKL